MRRWVPLVAALFLIGPPLLLVMSSAQDALTWWSEFDGRVISSRTTRRGCWISLRRGDTTETSTVHLSGEICGVANGSRIAKPPRALEIESRTGVVYRLPIRVTRVLVALGVAVTLFLASGILVVRSGMRVLAERSRPRALAKLGNPKIDKPPN